MSSPKTTDYLTIEQPKSVLKRKLSDKLKVELEQYSNPTTPKDGKTVSFDLGGACSPVQIRRVESLELESSVMSPTNTGSPEFGHSVEIRRVESMESLEAHIGQVGTPKNECERTLSHEIVTSYLNSSYTVFQSLHKMPPRPKTEWTRKRYALCIIQTILYCYCFVGVGFLNSIAGPLMEHLQKNSSVTAAQIGWILTAKGVGMVVGTPLSGVIFNMFKKHDDQEFKWWQLSLNRILLIMLVFMAGSLIFVPFVPNFAFMLVDHFLQGVFSGGVEVGCNLGIALVWREKVGSFMQLLHCSASFGSLIFPLITANLFLLVKNFQVQLILAYSLCGALILLVVVPLILIPSPKQGRNLQTKKRVSSAANIRLGPAKFFKNNIRKLVVELLSFSTLIFGMAGVLKGAATGGYSIFGNLLFQFCELRGMGDKVSLAYLTTAFWSSFTLGRAASIVLALFVPSFFTLFFGVGMTTLSYVLMIYFSSRRRFYGMWIAVIIHGICASPISASSMSVPQTSFNIMLNPASTSIVAFGSTLGEMIVPIVISSLQPYIGANTLLYVLTFTFSLALVDVVLMFVVGKSKLLIFDKIRKKKKNEDSSENEMKKKKNSGGNSVVKTFIGVYNEKNNDIIVKKKSLELRKLDKISSGNTYTKIMFSQIESFRRVEEEDEINNGYKFVMSLVDGREEWFRIIKKDAASDFESLVHRLINEFVCSEEETLTVVMDERYQEMEPAVEDEGEEKEEKKLQDISIVVTNDDDEATGEQKEKCEVEEGGKLSMEVGNGDDVVSNQPENNMENDNLCEDNREEEE